VDKPTHDQMADALADLASGVDDTTTFLSGTFNDALGDGQFDDESGFLALETTPRHWWRILSHLGATTAVLRRSAVVLREGINDERG
jgi:hypothetical protein